MERSFVVLVSVWRCQQASLGKAVDVQAAASLTPMTAAISVAIGVTMPTIATALAREVVAAAGLALVHALAPGPGPVGVVTTLIPVAVAAAGADAGLRHIPDAEAGLGHQLVPSPELQPGVVPGLDHDPAPRPGAAPSHDHAHDLPQPTTRGRVVPVQVQTGAQHQRTTE